MDSSLPGFGVSPKTLVGGRWDREGFIFHGVEGDGFRIESGMTS